MTVKFKKNKPGNLQMEKSCADVSFVFLFLSAVAIYLSLNT